MIIAHHDINQTRQDLTQHDWRMLVGNVGTELAKRSQRTVDCVWILTVQRLKLTFF